MVDIIMGCCFTELMKHKIRIPSEMVQNLMLLHSYILVKVRLNRKFLNCIIISTMHQELVKLPREHTTLYIDGAIEDASSYSIANC